MIETERKVAADAKRELPDGWRWARLGEVADYINGRAFKPEEWTTSGLPIIRIQNLNSSNAAYNYFDGVAEDRYRVNAGDLLISWSASLDAYIWQNGPAVLNQHIFKVIEHKNVIRRDYLYFAARWAMAEIRAQVHGATMQHITKPEFENVLIPVPSLAEQQRIAAVLREQMAAVERAHAAAEAELDAARGLPPAYLRAVFESDEAREWEAVPLQQIAQLLPSKSIASNGDMRVRAVTTACLTESGFNPAGVKDARMWRDDATECVLASGEILVARSNTAELVGRVAMYAGDPQGIVASDLTIRIMPSVGVYSPFLAAYLSSLYLRGYWKERAGGASGSMKKITRTQINALQVPLPDYRKQYQIATILNGQMEAADRVTRVLAMQLTAINQLPAALLRQAFSGEL